MGMGGQRSTGPTRSASSSGRTSPACPSTSRSGFGRMLASPFAFLRGSAAVMAADLSETPRSGLTVQACGDAHLLQLRRLRDPGAQPRLRHERLRRDATRAVGVGRQAPRRERRRGRAVPRSARVERPSRPPRCRRAPTGSGWRNSRSWATSSSGTANSRPRRSWPSSRRNSAGYAEESVRQGPEPDEHPGPREDWPSSSTARSGSSRRRRSSCASGDADRRATAQDDIQEWLNGYRASLANDRRYLIDQYTIVDVVLKVVGVGSVGTRCYVVLLRGDGSGDPLFLQVKEAPPRSLSRTCGRRVRHHGRRVVDGQRLIQPAPDIFLGWGRFTRRMAGCTRLLRPPAPRHEGLGHARARRGHSRTGSSGTRGCAAGLWPWPMPAPATRRR